MKLVTCADLIPHCTAEIRGDNAAAVVEQYAEHARYAHPEPVKVIDLMLSITAA